MREIARVLSPRGLALLEVPIREGVGDRRGPRRPRRRSALRRFGQRDHVRWYGDDIDARFSAAGLATVRVTPPALLGEAAVRVVPADAPRGRVDRPPGQRPRLADAGGRQRVRADRGLRRGARRAGTHARAARARACAQRPAGRPARRPARAAAERTPRARSRGCSPGFVASRASDWIGPWMPWVTGST